MITKTWRQLAEAIGVDEAGAYWQKANQKKNMQRWGTSDRRNHGDPLMLAKQRNKAQAMSAPPNMTPRLGGIGAPAGTDRPGQGNPLMTPSAAKPGLGRNMNAPRPPVPTDGPTDLGTQFVGGGDKHWPGIKAHGVDDPCDRADDHDMQDDQWLSMLLGDRDDMHDDD